MATKLTLEALNSGFTVNAGTETHAFTSLAELASFVDLNLSFKPSRFDVILIGYGDRKIAVIKEVRLATGYGLRESKALVEAEGVQVLQMNVDEEQAMRVQGRIHEAGGYVDVVIHNPERN